MCDTPLKGDYKFVGGFVGALTIIHQSLSLSLLYWMMCRDALSWLVPSDVVRWVEGVNLVSELTE